MVHGRRVVLAPSKIVVALVLLLSRVHASVYVDTPFSQKIFDSVSYFDFEDTAWPFMKDSGDMLVGPVKILTGNGFDNFFMDYQEIQNVETDPPSTELDLEIEAESSYSLEQSGMITDAPIFLLVELGGSTYSSSLANIAAVAQWLDADFVVLIISRNTRWYEKVRFWWSHTLPGISDKVVTAEERFDTRNDEKPCRFLAVGPRQGTMLLNLLDEFQTWKLEPSVFYFGIDNLTTMRGRSLLWRIAIYLTFTALLCRWIRIMDRRDRRRKEGQESLVKYTGDELALGEVQTAAAHECCVCLENMQPGEQVRVLPCRHVFHHECIDGWFNQHKYSCPMCKLDLKKHLEERRVASQDIDALPKSGKKSPLQRWWMWKRRIDTLSDSHLIEERIGGENGGVGDLELSEDRGVVV